MKTERMVILVSPEQKAVIAERAQRLKLSTAEMVRRAVDSYSPSADEAALNALADELQHSARETRRAIREAIAEVDATVAHIARQRKARRRAA